MFEFGALYNSTSGRGIDSQLLDVFAKRTGCSIERVVMPRARIWAELKGGSLDMATAAISTPERESYGYLLPYMVSRNVVLIRKSSSQYPASLTDLVKGNLRVGAVRSFKHEAAYDAALAELSATGRVKEVADVAELLKFLERGLVDAVISQPIVYRQYLSSSFIDNELVVKDLAPKDQQSVGNLILSRKAFTPEQALRWDRLVSSMLADGTLYKINQEFLPSKEARGLIYSGPRNPD